MKKAFKLLVLSLTSILMVTGCNKGQDNNSSFEDYTPSEEVKNEEVYLKLFETRTYPENSKVSYEATFDDPSLVTYEEGRIVSNIKAGHTVAHFRSAVDSFDVEIYVTQDSTVPHFDLEYRDLSIYKNSTFSMGVYLIYNNVDVSSYLESINVTKETDAGTSRVEVENSRLLITGLNEGVDKYSIYTSFLGFTLSKSLSVNTRINDSLTVCGRSISYNNDGPIYDVSLYKYSQNKIDLSTDLIVSKGGETIPYSQLTITSGNTDILQLSGSILEPKKAGKTSLLIAYQGESLTIQVNLTKPVLDHRTINLSDKDFDLNKSVEFHDDPSYSPSNPKGYRTYLNDASASKKIALNAEETFIGLNSLSIEGNKESVSPSSYTYNQSTKELTLKGDLFDEKVFGDKTLNLEMECLDYFVDYEVTIHFITHALKTVEDIKQFLVVRYDTEVILGYYTLANDIDYAGSLLPSSWISLSNGVNYAYGFRGVLDGQNHSIKNARATSYGLIILIGNGAVMKDIKFTNVLYESFPTSGSSGSAIIGRFISGATFENIEITLDKNSITNRGEPTATTSIGLISTEVTAASLFKNITIHAEGFDILRLFAKNASGSVFENVKLYAKSLRYVFGVTAIASGVTLVG